MTTNPSSIGAVPPLPSPTPIGSSNFSALQQFVLYESRTLMVITGRDPSGHISRILTLDRTVPYELKVTEDPKLYHTQQELETQVQLLIQNSGTPLERTIQVSAILGFIRLPKLFIVLVLNREKVGSIGGRWIYSITDWKLKAVGHKSFDLKRPAAVNKYKAMILEDIELQKDFYFSHYYDLTHTMQMNLQAWKVQLPTSHHKTSASTTNPTETTSSNPTTSQPPQGNSSSFPSVPPLPLIEDEIFDPLAFDPIANPIPQNRRRTITTTLNLPPATNAPPTKMEVLSEEGDDTDDEHSALDQPRGDSSSTTSFLSTSTTPTSNTAATHTKTVTGEHPSPSSSTVPRSAELFFNSGGVQSSTTAASSPPSSAPPAGPLPPLPADPYHPVYAEKWLWNIHLAREFLHFIPHGSYWLVPLIHGFVQQHSLRIGRRDVLVTLIARRSRHFAGTRYIKRGVSPNGHVANEVESEQIIQLRESYSQGNGDFSSVVMLRGSIPLYWANDNPKAPKPDIVVYNFDRDFISTKRHFEDCFHRYGSPCAVLSLIKKEEKVPLEGRLGMAFNHAIQKVSATFLMERIRDQIQQSVPPQGKSKEQLLAEEMKRISDQIAREGNKPFPNTINTNQPPTATTSPIAMLPIPSPPAASTNSNAAAITASPSPTAADLLSPASSSPSTRASDRIFSNRVPPYDHPSYEPNTILYCTYDFLGQRAKQGNVLRDLKGLVSNLVDEIGVFTYISRPPSQVEISSPSEDPCVISVQKGVIRVNCIDCLDRTNVGQFCIGKAAIKIQLKNLGINVDAEDQTSFASSNSLTASLANNDVYPELVAILQDMYTQHGDRIAHQYAGSGAMHKEILYDTDEGATDENIGSLAELESGGRSRKDATTAKAPSKNITQNALSAIKRYYNNNFSDSDKQSAINVFLGNYVPTLTTVRPPIWELDVYNNLQDSDLLFAKDGERFRTPFIPQSVVVCGNANNNAQIKRSQLMANALPATTTNKSTAPSPHPRDPNFNQYFIESYQPTVVTSFDEELKKSFQLPIVVKLPTDQMNLPVIPVASPTSAPNKPDSDIKRSKSPSPSPTPINTSNTTAATVLPTNPIIKPGPLTSINEQDEQSSQAGANVNSNRELPSSTTAVTQAPTPKAAHPIKRGFGSLFSSAKASFSAVMHSNQAATATPATSSAANSSSTPTTTTTPSSKSQGSAAPSTTTSKPPISRPASRPTENLPVANPATNNPSTTATTTPSSSSSMSSTASSTSKSGLTSLSSLLSTLNVDTPSSDAPQFTYPTSFVAPSTSSALYTGWSPRVTQKRITPFHVPRLSQTNLKLDDGSSSIGTIMSTTGENGSDVELRPQSLLQFDENELAIPPEYLHSPAQDHYALERFHEYVDTTRLFHAPPLAFAVPFEQFETQLAAEASILSARGLVNQTAVTTQPSTSASSSNESTPDRDPLVTDTALLAASLKLPHHQLVDLLLSNLHDLQTLQLELDTTLQYQQQQQSLIQATTPPRKAYLAATPFAPIPFHLELDPQQRRSANDAQMHAHLNPTASNAGSNNKATTTITTAASTAKK